MSHSCISDVIPFSCCFLALNQENPLESKICDSEEYVNILSEDVETGEEYELNEALSHEERITKFLTPEKGREFVEILENFGNKKRLYGGNVWRKIGTELSVICYNCSRYNNVGEVEGCVVTNDRLSIEEFVKDFSFDFSFLLIEENDSVQQWL